MKLGLALAVPAGFSLLALNNSDRDVKLGGKRFQEFVGSEDLSSGVDARRPLFTVKQSLDRFDNQRS